MNIAPVELLLKHVNQAFLVLALVLTASILGCSDEDHARAGTLQIPAWWASQVEQAIQASVR